MTETFDQFLSRIGAARRTAVDALRRYVFPSRELTEQQMRQALLDVGRPPAEVEKEVQDLGANFDLLVRRANDFFARAWRDEANRTAIEAAFKAGRRPVRIRGGGPQNSLLALVLLYATAFPAGQSKSDQSSSPTGVNQPHQPVAQQVSATGEAERLDRALAAFTRDLPTLLETVPRQWVAYHGPNRVATGPTQTAVYQDCLNRQFNPRELFVVLVHPAAADEVEVFLPAEDDLTP